MQIQIAAFIFRHLFSHIFLLHAEQQCSFSSSRVFLHAHSSDFLMSDLLHNFLSLATFDKLALHCCGKRLPTHPLT